MTTRVWRGIRYATVPHRFAAPEPVRLDAVPAPGGEFGPVPEQPGWPGVPMGPTTESSLSLNVTSPGDGSYPVVVYIFGGGFEGGTGSLPWLDATSLATAAQSVVVTLDHRVGAVGWAQLAHHGGDLASASNLGLQDVLCALEWVHAHVAAFGGDPSHVTLAGSSSGAFQATALLAAPRANGLFHRLAAFSGGASRIVGVGAAVAISDAILDRLGASDDPSRLLSTPVEDLFVAQAEVVATDIGVRNSRTPRAFGVVGDYAAGLLGSHPMTAVEEGAARDIPVWLATARHEVSAMRRDDFVPASQDALDAEIHSIAGPASPEPLRRTYTGELGLAREQLLSDYIYRLPAARAARAQAAAGGRATLVDIGAAGTERAGHGVEAAAAFARPRNPRDDALLDAYLAFLAGDDPGPGAVRSLVVGGADDDVRSHDELLTIWDGVDRP